MMINDDKDTGELNDIIRQKEKLGHGHMREKTQPKVLGCDDKELMLFIYWKMLQYIYLFITKYIFNIILHNIYMYMKSNMVYTIKHFSYM